jgi:acid phosphatase family membrane protein YuiD
MYNSYILVPFATWAVAQLTKFVLSAARGNLDLRKLYASGGMPSVHAAVTVSLATTAFILDGASSHLFGFTAIFSAIVMYDSLGVRRSSGEQGVALNMIITSLSRDKVLLSQPDLKLREVLGHKPREVVVGAIFGLVLGILLNFNHVSPLAAFLVATPGLLETYIYAGIAAALIVVPIIMRLMLRRRRSAILSRLGARIMYTGLTAGIIIAIFALGQYERLSYLDWRLWMIIALLVTSIEKLRIMLWARTNVTPARELETRTERLSKWLPKPKKKKSKKR